MGGWNVGECQTGRPYHGGLLYSLLDSFVGEFERVAGEISVQQFSRNEF